MLFLRLVIDDRYALRASTAPLGAPFTFELGDHCGVEVFGPGGSRSATAAGQLGPCQHGIEERAPRVGIDLDQSGSLRAEVEIIAHKGTCGSGVDHGILRGPGQDPSPIVGEGGSGLQSLDDGQHMVQFLTGNEDSGIGKELLPGRAGQDFAGVVPQLTGKIGNDCWPIEGDAETVPVQPFRFCLFRRIIGWLQELSSIYFCAGLFIPSEPCALC